MASDGVASDSIRRRLLRTSWYGLKPACARLLRAPVVNPLLRRASRVLLPEDLRYRLPVSARQAAYRLGSGGTVFLSDPQADQIAKNIVWGNGAPTSPAESRILRFIEERAPRIDLLLDVGAYSCLFSLIAAKTNPDARAIAFEVLPENYLLCARNIIRNDVVRQVEVRLCGVGKTEGEILMPIQTDSAANPTSVSLSADFETGITVPVVTVDSLGLSGRMLWKIDVEGHELGVLLGARETLQRSRPDIVCEILQSFPHSAELQALLQPLGYKFFIALPDGMEERPSIAPDPRARDWIFSAAGLD